MFFARVSFTFSSRRFDGTRQVLIRAHRGDCLEDFRQWEPSTKLDNRLASRTRLRREQHTLRFERHRRAHNILE